MVLTFTLGQFILSSPLPDEDEPKAFVRNERQALAKRRQLLAQRLLGVKDSTDDTCDSQIFYNVEDIKNASLNVKSDCKIIDRSCRRKCKKFKRPTRLNSKKKVMNGWSHLRGGICRVIHSISTVFGVLYFIVCL